MNTNLILPTEITFTIFVIAYSRIYRSGWWIQRTTNQEELRYIILLSAGVLFVVNGPGLIRLEALSVVSWDSMEWTRQGIMLTMAEEVVQYCFSWFNALVANHTYGNAVIVDGICTGTAVAMVMVQVLIVTDDRNTMNGIGLAILLI